MDIKAAVTHGLGEEFKLETAQLAEPEFDEICVRIVATGVCHTDAVARDLGSSLLISWLSFMILHKLTKLLQIQPVASPSSLY